VLLTTLLEDMRALLRVQHAKELSEAAPALPAESTPVKSAKPEHPADTGPQKKQKATAPRRGKTKD
jgi:hypothetical protein